MNKLLYSGRVFGLGDTHSGLLLCRNALEDLLLLRYFHEVKPADTHPWLRMKLHLSPRKVRNALPQRDDLERLYSVLCRATHANPEKVVRLRVLSEQHGALFLGGTAVDPDRIRAYFDFPLLVTFMAGHRFSTWYRPYLPACDGWEEEELRPYFDAFAKTTRLFERGYYTKLLRRHRRQRAEGQADRGADG